jgi:fatty acid desaturase
MPRFETAPPLNAAHRAQARPKQAGVFALWPVGIVVAGLIATLVWVVWLGWLLIQAARAIF